MREEHIVAHRLFEAGDIFEHPELAGIRSSVSDFFAAEDLKRRSSPHE